MDKIFERIIIIRKKFAENQKEFADRLDIPPRSLQNYESGRTENIPHSFLKKLVDLGFDSNWLISGIGKPERSEKSIFDDSILPKFELLKTACPEEKYDSVLENVLEDMNEVIDRKVADLLVDDLMKRVNQTPIFEKIKALIIMNEIGATVRIWNIIEIAASDQSKLLPKEKILNAVKGGTFIVPQSRSERELLEKFVDGWNDETCEYLLDNAKNFTETLKKISTKIESAISSNQKILELVKKVRIYLDR
jgi:transcriptional regulator with XRE-family HTH domain